MPEKTGYDNDAVTFIQGYMRAVAETLEKLPWDSIGQVVEVLHQARLCRAHVFICGNGGSAATASHFVNDLNKGANAPGVPRFQAIGLTDNVPLLTAWSNDASYDDAFVEPLRNLVQPGDVLIGISGSGNSPNVLKAVRSAQEMGATAVGFTCSQGGKLDELADLAIGVPNTCMEQLEDVHMFLEHAIVSTLRDRAQRDLVPSLILANGRGATPATRAFDPALSPRSAVLLDRDGVINENNSSHVKSWSEFHLLPGALDALRLLARTPYPVVVVTNQAVINRGMISFEVADSINRRLMTYVAERGGRIDAIACCPHGFNEACGCRKPEPGMLTYAAESLNLDLSRSYFVGDAETDIAAGMAVGCKTALVLTGRGEAQREGVVARWGERCEVLVDLPDAVRWILTDSGQVLSP
jgi:D-sedoheptulose 7-phosphate isomerase